MICLAVFLAACGPEFKSEDEELEYLQSLSNPTVEQFRKRKELQEKRLAERKRISDEIDKAREIENQQFEQQRAAEEARNYPIRAKEALEEAARWEKITTAAQTSKYYREVAEQYPGTDAAKDAEVWINAYNARIGPAAEALKKAKEMQEKEGFESALPLYREVVERYKVTPAAEEAQFIIGKR